jgi:hypothetical protein
MVELASVSVTGERNAAYDQFLEDLQKGGTGECRYGLFDFEYTHQCQGTSEVTFVFVLYDYVIALGFCLNPLAYTAGCESVGATNVLLLILAFCQ